MPLHKTLTPPSMLEYKKWYYLFVQFIHRCCLCCVCRQKWMYESERTLFLHLLAPESLLLFADWNVNPLWIGSSSSCGGVFLHVHLSQNSNLYCNHRKQPAKNPTHMVVVLIVCNERKNGGTHKSLLYIWPNHLVFLDIKLICQGDLFDIMDVNQSLMPNTVLS